MPDMNEETKREIWPFITQLPSVCLGAIVFGHVIIRSLSTVGPKEPASWAGHVFLLTVMWAFPAGLIALAHIKKHAGELGRLEKPTKVLAIINIIMGGLLIGFIVFLVIFAIVAVFSGITA